MGYHQRRRLHAKGSQYPVIELGGVALIVNLFLMIGSCLIKTDHLWTALVMNGLIGEPVASAGTHRLIFLGRSVLGVLLRVAVSSAFLWLAR